MLFLGFFWVFSAKKLLFGVKKIIDDFPTTIMTVEN